MHALYVASRARMERAAVRQIPTAPALRSVTPPEMPKPAIAPSIALDDLRAKAAELSAHHDPATPWRLQDLIVIAAAAGGISVAVLKSDRRMAKIVRPRQVFFWLARQFATDRRRSYPFIGTMCGGRDHTTVLHGFRHVERVIAEIGRPEHDAPDTWAAHLLANWPAAARREATYAEILA